MSSVPTKDSEPKLPVVPIVAGVLERSGHFLLSQRRPGSHLEGLWEFPGGQVQPGESLEEALKRELEEEVGMRFRDSVLLHVEEHAYPDRRVTLHFFLCLDPEGEPEAREGQEIRWLQPEDLSGLRVPSANQQLIRLLVDQYGSSD